MTVDVRDLADLGPGDRAAFFDRDAGIEAVRGDVREIVDQVREEGDVAIREFTSKFDDVELGNITITDDCERAYEELDAALLDAIETAVENVREFHEAQLPDDWRDEFGPGRELGRRFRPLERVGVYVPGGSAAYPSSAIMGVVPAVVAGVEHVSVVTPPADELNPVTLAAIHAAGADAVYSVGGAQAIAGFAYGTETITRVQKIVGPGNKWVTAAKAEVRGDVEIDFLAGPSEIVVVADETADPDLVAAELIAQAEHDPSTSVVAITDDAETAEATATAVDEQVDEREREEIIRAGLDNDASGILLARSMSEAILFTEEYAPEHLSILADDDESVLERIDSAGSVFLGSNTPVAAGDYASGTNHVLPTNGNAHVTGGLSVETFLRSTTVQRLSADGLEEIGETITTLADAEGLEAHAASVRRRLEGLESDDS
ncbi:histidinol dehydrogenase [Natronorubrum thiooxidans]|uniref:Histidinol dehydrogenase n=1 Tax=Natronorubrum thiooxidans TaxID=308853 RepID=A0A1N7E9Z5_9EURY|nr:histidinol dehydrogenase [Natronorubrum thiooxidans]SIR84775.1 histidinol dehydrogenase [Natronorubrum thiooxidans]